jgi:hypothetical protein
LHATLEEVKTHEKEARNLLVRVEKPSGKKSKDSKESKDSKDSKVS